MNRNLDGVYLRVKRGGRYVVVCFSDLTPDERDVLFDTTQKPIEWWQSLAYHLADQLRTIGDTFDLVMEEGDS